MKFIAASLLAIAASAIHLKQEDGTQGPPQGPYGDMELPFPAPECPAKPTGEYTDEEIWNKIDYSGNGAISAQEGFNALYCLVEWGEMDVEKAIFMYEFLGDHANMDENGVADELDPAEAEAAFQTLEDLSNLPDCGEMPANADEMTPEDIFGHIDQDGNGGIDEQEGIEALNCVV